MYSTICRATSDGNTDPVICRMIVAGFTGQLRGWWENFLSLADREAKATASHPGVDIFGKELPANRPDAVYSLILTIIEHFSGRFTNVYENIRTMLNGLKSRKLGEFRWYKDTFLSRVMDLPESNSDHWKAKFIDSLPYLFAERVRETLRGNNTQIPYNVYTYGTLIGVCTQEGLNLCNELRLNHQLKKQRLTERNQLGEFCNQFAMEDIPSSSKKKRSDKGKTYQRKVKRNQRRSKEEREERKRYRKEKRFVKDRSKRDLKNTKCYRCGKFGHIAPNCKKKFENFGIRIKMISIRTNSLRL